MAEMEITTGTIPFKKGTYTGELRNGLPHGRGVYSCEAHFHEGEWHEGWMSDYGCMAESEGRIYNGCWRAEDNQSGALQFNPPRGTIYDGGWKDGLKHGMGRLQLKDGSQKIGIWEDDRFSRAVDEAVPDTTGKASPSLGAGHPLKVVPSPDAVPFRNGLYVGGVKDGVPHGRGRFTCDDYSYEGDWENGSRHGAGTCATSKTVYRGSWVNDKRQGNGVETARYLEFSSRYEGAWQNDLKHGHGILAISNGTVYDGGWKDGRRHGHGTEVSTQYGIKSKYVGEWKNGQKNGLGKEVTVVHGMKSEYKGGWRNNQKYGFGKEFIDGGGIRIRSCKVNLRKFGDM